jgi:hypothetical protein
MPPRRRTPSERGTGLKALRTKLFAELADAAGRDVAAIARELRAVMAEIETLPSERKDSPVDDLAAKRASRRAAAAGQ